MQGVLAGDRAVLGRAISLVESNAHAHHELAQRVLTQLLPHTGKAERVLWRGGRVLSPTSPDATALLTVGDRIAWVGPEADAPAADRTEDLGGGLATPAFVDSHVHLTATGNALAGLHFAEHRSAAAVLDHLDAFARTTPADALVLAGGWDETAWDDPELPTGEAIEAAAGGRIAYLSRACGHTGIATPRLLAEHPELAAHDGYDPSGVLTRAAHKAARATLGARVPVSQRLALAEYALATAARRGIAAVVEHFIPVAADPPGEQEFQGLVALGANPANPSVHGWWGELRAAKKARDLGAHGCGGDLSAAWLFASLSAFFAAGIAVVWAALALFLGTRMKSWTRDDARSSPSLQPGR